MPLTPDEELQLVDAEIALKQKTSSPVAGVIKQGINAIPGVGPAVNLAEHFSKLPPETQKAALASLGGEVGLAGGPAMAGIGAATGGGLAEAAQNPQTAINTLAPIVKTAFAPTSESVAGVVKSVTQPGTKEFLKRRGTEAGTAAVAGAALKGIRAIGTSGPVSAGIENPSMVFKGVRGKILEELGIAKGQAMKGENLAEGQRLMKMLRAPAGQGKLADEAIKAVENGTKMSNTQLLAYDEALGKVQTKGGTFAQIYKGARDSIRVQLKEQAPTLFARKAMARKVFLSQGEGEGTSLINAVQNISPKGLMNSIASSPALGRTIGAGTRLAAESAFPSFVASSSFVSDALQKFAKKRRGQ